MHKTGFARRQLRGGAAPVYWGSLLLFYWLAAAPGPGGSQGNLTVPPASKDAESPSYLFPVSCKGSGGGYPPLVKYQTISRFFLKLPLDGHYEML